MSRRRKKFAISSLDMLLDTMCNTFGGVCFIALLVAIISASLPKETAETPPEPTPVEQEDPEVRQALVDELARQLTEQRDELKASLATMQRFAETVLPESGIPRSAIEWRAAVRTNEEAKVELERKRDQLQRELARAKASNDTDREEYDRLERVAKELEEKLDQPHEGPHRVVRLPNERTVSGLHSIDLWLHQGMLYNMDDTSEVAAEHHPATALSREKLTLTLRLGTGRRVTEDFCSSSAWGRYVNGADARTCVRIWADASSFEALCRLRDDLIKRRIQYNWYDTDGATSKTFVYGSIQVQ